MSPKRIYLAGPDVFHPDAERRYEHLKSLCLAHGFEGIAPFDGECAGAGEAESLSRRIYRENLARLASCDAVLANLSPFRGMLEPDSGTAFEVGYAVALGLPVAGYSPELAEPYQERIARLYGRREQAPGKAFDAHFGMLIEEFGLGLNLMLAHGCLLATSPQEALAALARAVKTRA